MCYITKEWANFIFIFQKPTFNAMENVSLASPQI